MTNELRDEIGKVLGRQLTLRIMSSGMTQEDFAKATNIPKSVMSSYCRGSDIPYPERLKTISSALGCEIKHLLPTFYERP